MTPAYSIIVNGQAINIDRRQLIELSITDNPAFEADELSIELHDKGNTLAIPSKGAVIECAIGWRINGVDQLVDKGRFVVDEIKYSMTPRTLRIEAKSANFRAGVNSIQNRTYNNKTLGDILLSVAKRQSLDAKIAPELSSIAIEHIDQVNESDGHFLTRLGMQYDAVANIKNTSLLFLPNAQGKTAGGRALSNSSYHVSQCERVEYSEQDRDSEYTGIQAKWRDKDNTGGIVWETAGSDEKPQKIKRLYPSKAEAAAAAQAKWSAIQRSGKSLGLDLASGNPSQTTEQPIRISGVKDSIDKQNWIAQKVFHTLSGSGYITSISAQPHA